MEKNSIDVGDVREFTKNKNKKNTPLIIPTNGWDLGISCSISTPAQTRPGVSLPHCS